MDKGADSSAVGEGRFRRSRWGVVMVAGMFAVLLIMQPAGAQRSETVEATAEDEAGGPETGVDQIQAPFADFLCQSLRQFEAAVRGFPSVGPVIAGLLRQFGCVTPTTPTTLFPTTVPLPGNTTTSQPPTTVTTLPGATTTPTTSTTLPPCPSTTSSSSSVPPPTTVPCNPNGTTVPTTPTTLAPCPSTTTGPTTSTTFAVPTTSLPCSPAKLVEGDIRIGS